MLRTLIAASALLLGIGAVRAEKLEVIGIAGLAAEVEVSVRSMIPGEGRQTYLLAGLDKDAPFLSRPILPYHTDSG